MGGIVTGVQVYRTAKITYEAYCWIKRFGEYLMTNPGMRNIPSWLWKNPPDFMWDVLMYYSAKILFSTFLGSEKVNAFEAYSKATFRCGDYEVCIAVKKFLTGFG